MDCVWRRMKRPLVNDFLLNCKIFLDDRGSLAGKVRRDILNKQIDSHGGVVVTDKADSTHLLICPKLQRPSDGYISVDWLCGSLEKGRRLAEDKYRMSTPEPFQSLEEPEIAINDIGQKISVLFEKLAVSLTKGGADEFRARNYRKAARLLKDKEDAFFKKNLQHLREPPFSFGVSIFAKILEFLETGRIGKIDFLVNDEKSRAIAELSTVWGVGLVTAEKLWSQGIKSVEELRSAKDLKLSRSQLIGLKYWEELQLRIPRQEVADIASVAEKVIRNRFGENVTFEVAGSFRRGADDCGDVDIIICSDKGGHVLWEVVEDLCMQGFITDKLNSGDADESLTTFHGICQLNKDSLHRRIDIKLWSEENYPYALLHFTGNDHFNRLMRFIAKNEGCKLTDHGLFRQGKRITCKTERDIFDALRFVYLEPELRQPENLKRK